jgi:hypothetical protein
MRYAIRPILCRRCNICYIQNPISNYYHTRCKREYNSITKRYEMKFQSVRHKYHKV